MKRHAVWRKSTFLMSYQTAAWHARLAGCTLAISCHRDGVTGATVERRRADDGGFDTIDRKTWPKDDAQTLLAAQEWCESTARAAPKPA